MEYFLPFRIFEELALALKNRVCPEFFHCMEHNFYIQNVEQLALALKNRVALKFFTVLNILFTFRSFEKLALALKNRVCPEIFQAREGGSPPDPRLVRL